MITKLVNIDYFRIEILRAFKVQIFPGNIKATLLLKLTIIKCYRRRT